MKETYAYKNLIELFEQNIQRAKEFRDIPDDLLILKPDSKSWSAGEIFQHLVKFNRLYLSFIREAVDKSDKERTENNTFKPRFLVSLIIKFLRPPYKIRIGTIAPMYPVDTESDNYRRYLEELIESNENMINEIQTFKEEQLDLNRLKGKNPVFKFNMTVTEFLLMFEAHQQRHFWQTKKTIKKLSGKTF
jgi:uncharacterized damage-inducible protein DinB